MNKIKKEIRYKELSFDLIRQVKGLKMYFDTDSSYCIIVDNDDNVLFEIRADSCQNGGILEDAGN